MEGVLSAIKYVRESNTPFLGTCGGFQHAVIEYARNLLQIKNAGHTEYNQETEFPLIDLLECSLVEKTGSIIIEKGSKLYEIIRKIRLRKLTIVVMVLTGNSKKYFKPQICMFLGETQLAR